MEEMRNENYRTHNSRKYTVVLGIVFSSDRLIAYSFFGQEHFYPIISGIMAKKESRKDWESDALANIPGRVSVEESS